MGARRGKFWAGRLLLAAVLIGPAWAIAADAIVEDFVDEVVLTGLTYPTNVEFAPNGKVFVAEKSGKIKVFDSLSDPTPDVFADLGPQVHDFWDRGMLGLAIHPNFPTTPYIYVLYAYDAKPGGSHPTWGDACPTPPGATDKGCVVTGRLSRLTASGNVMVPGSELVMVQDWCQQYPSHSTGDLEFGSDGALYATGGDGASFNWVDYGQGPGDTSNPKNPCSDPPGTIGSTLSAPTAEGGALRSQDLRTSGDPVTLDGTVIRVDPLTGEALPTNPGYASNSDPNGKRIVAYGLRNPFRFVVKPGTSELFIGDVGWNLWEEVNRHPNPGSAVKNFGWPCYEGGSGTSIKQAGYDTSNLNICENLYTSPAGTVTAPLFAYHHEADIAGSDPCPPANPPQGTSSSISGLAFYSSGGYPGTYNGALFGSDYSRNCIWVMFPDASGTPDPSTVEVFQHLAAQPVDMEAGPDGDIFYPSFNQTGTIHRLRFIGDNNPPTAVISAIPTSGAAPLVVNFGSSGSSDPDSDALTFTWDLDNDGAYDDATGPTAQWTYATPGAKTAKLKATDARGESDTDTTSISVSNSPPVPVIDTPAASLLWSVGQDVAFSGHATDPDQGNLPAAALSWELIMHHCADDGSCHTHPIQAFTGTSSGSFVAPDHEYPSWLELKLTATDQFGSAVTVSREIDPLTVDLTFDSSPSGLEITFGGVAITAPLTKTFIVNSVITIGAESQIVGGEEWLFQGWSDGGEASHSFTAPSTPTTYTAFFAQTGPEQCDFNDDGYSDLAFGVEELPATPLASGGVEVIYGSDLGLAEDGRQVWGQDSLGILGTAAKGDDYGASLACGDYDADGYQDLVIGIPGEDFGGYADAGAASVLFGSSAGLTADDDVLLRRTTATTPEWVTSIAGTARKGDGVGQSISAGDFNGDGHDDVAIGAPADNVDGVGNAGSVNVVYGADSGFGGGRIFHRDSAGMGGAAFADGGFGTALVGGDFNGDGMSDLAMSAPGADTNGVDHAGALNVLFGTPTGLKTAASQLLSADTTGVPGDTTVGDHFGLAVTSGDFDGDGHGDLAIGVGSQVSGKIGAGAVIVVPGSSIGLDPTLGSLIDRDQPGVAGAAGKNDGLGSSLIAADFDDDGYADLAIGAPGDSHDGANEAGAVNVLHGSATGLSTVDDQLWNVGESDLPGFPADFSRFGESLGVGDHDGDGYAGLAISSTRVPPNGPGGTVTVMDGTSAGLVGSGSGSWDAARITSLSR